MAKTKVRMYLDGKEWDEIVEARDYQDAKNIALSRNSSRASVSSVTAVFDAPPTPLKKPEPIQKFPSTNKSNKVNQEDATLTIALVKGLFWLTWEGIKGLFKLSKFIISSIGKGIKGIYRIFKQID